MRLLSYATFGTTLLLCSFFAHGASELSFFITSSGPGDGANLGGLAGADAHCQRLANTAGAGSRTWHAYLSTSGEGATVGFGVRNAKAEFRKIIAEEVSGAEVEEQIP